ncbi:MAG: integrin alpha [Gammaproteobacteria bacterium]
MLGANGFQINGEAAFDYAALRWKSGLGDVNGDGLADLLIGAYRASPHGSASGAAYVVFGKPSLGASGVLPLSALNGANGFKLNGAFASDRAGIAVSGLGDVNGDGLRDLMVGAFGGDPNGANSGTSYVVFGKKTPPPDLIFQDSFE